MSSVPKNTFGALQKKENQNYEKKPSKDRKIEA